MGAFQRSLALLFAIGRQLVLSLGGWSPRIQTGFPVSGPTREYCQERELRFRIQGYHLLWPAFPGGSASAFLCNSPDDPARPSKRSPATPDAQRTRTSACARFRLVPVRSPLLRESRFLSFPELTEMFHFSSCRFTRPMYSGADAVTPHGRLLHWRSPDITLACSSPGLIAAYHVLCRLLAPRHPPYTLCSLIATTPSPGRTRRHIPN